MAAAETPHNSGVRASKQVQWHGSVSAIQSHYYIYKSYQWFVL